MVDSIGPRTLGDLWDWLAREHGDDPFMTFEWTEGVIHRASYRQMNTEINRAANLFIDYDIKRGDNVVIQLPSSPEFMGAQFALAKIGAVAVPINLEYQRPECEHVISVCQSDVVIVAAEYANFYAHLPGIRLLIIVGHLTPGDSVPHVPGIEKVISLEDRRNYSGEYTSHPDLTSDDTAMILFTSGTTSAPKGVVITHANCLYAGWYGNWQAAMSSVDRMLTPMPMAHSNFQLAALMPVLTSATELIVVSRYSARRFWKQVRRHQATVIQAVAMMVKTLLLQPPNPADADNTVRDVLYYLPLSDETKAGFEQRFGVRLLNSYGLTETITWVITDFPLGPRRWPSVGRVGLGYEARIVDDNGQELPPGEVGEILIKGVPGRTLMKEYYRDPAATAAAMSPDGWLHTHDRGYVDADGWFYFVGRSHDLIKRSGRNISALEVEAVLTAHPDVSEAAVIGVTDEIRDESVRAFVTPRDGCLVDVDAVRDFVADRLATYKVPSEILVVDDMPHTSTGKIAKHLLDHTPAPEQAVETS